MSEVNAVEYVSGLIARARAAQKIAEGFDQEKVDQLCAAVTWATVQEDVSRKIAKLAYDESQMGVEEAKHVKMQIKPVGHCGICKAKNRWVSLRKIRLAAL